MSSAREQLDKIDSDLKALRDKQAELSEQEYNLSEERQKLISAVLVEEKPFDGTEWELMLGSNNNAYLLYIAGNHKHMEEVRDLCFRSWHDSFELQEGIELHFDDGKYSLHFNDPRQLSIFAQKQNFIIVAPDIVDNVRQLSKQLTTLQELVHQFNLKA